MSTGIIILAAGNSTRLGKPKQLLQYRGESFINRIVNEAVNFTDQVVVVTGAGYERIIDGIKNNKILICQNPEWETGMASSIHAGLKELLLVFPNLGSCIITVTDQPYVDAGLFGQLLSQHRDSGKGIVASGYAETMGIPVFFERKYFDELLHLDGQEGARKLLKKYSVDVAEVPFEKGAIDIDTIDDYNNLIS